MEVAILPATSAPLIENPGMAKACRFSISPVAVPLLREDL
jgi:hypothetical protein